MRYELYLRAGDEPAPGAPLSWDATREALALAGVDAAQGLPVELDLGQGRLRLEAYRPAPEGSAPPAGDPPLAGLNASFPLGLVDAEGDRAVAVVLRVADQLGAVVFDPQLGRLVTRGDHERILTAWRRSYDFHLGVVGAAALGAGAPAPARPERSPASARLKLVLWLALGVLVAGFFLRACFDRWMDRQWSPPVPGQVEPMAPGDGAAAP